LSLPLNIAGDVLQCYGQRCDGWLLIQVGDTHLHANSFYHPLPCEITDDVICDGVILLGMQLHRFLLVAEWGCAMCAAVQPSQVPDFGIRYGIQIGQAFGYDFGIGIIRDICFVSFVIV